MDKLIWAIIQVESGGDDWAIGDRHLADKAYGPMQIRQPVCIDVNRVYGTNRRAEDMLGNRALSADTFTKYMAIYATWKRLWRPVTDRDRSLIWNAGPMGYKSGDISYWIKVSRALASYRG